MGISTEEQDWRVEVVRQARHSSEMEGVVTDAVTRADEDEWAQGRIDEEELIRRANVRYTVPG